MTKKMVTVDVVVRIEVEVPEDWADDSTEFWLKESSLCSGDYVASRLTDKGCGCNAVKSVRVVHEP